MILLTKNNENNCIFTLTEKTSITGTSAVQYLFEVISDDNYQNVLYFTGEDISVNKVRYNQFNIIETGSTYVNLTASTINLSTPGYYSYNVYQCPTGVTASLSTAVGTAIENGKILFSGATINQVQNTYTGATTLYIYNN